MSKLLAVFETGEKLKKVMKAKRLTKAKCKCPHCPDGMIFGSLNGKKEHLHFACNACGITFME